jgi:hypothetical protein
MCKAKLQGAHEMNDEKSGGALSTPTAPVRAKRCPIYLTRGPSEQSS